jgi:predicted thioesterase
MIMVMENAALNAIRAYLDPGESAVGTAVNVRHLAATPVGRLVTGEAEVTKVDGRQIEFTLRAIEGCQGDRGRLTFQGRHRDGQIHTAARMSNA